MTRTSNQRKRQGVIEGRAWKKEDTVRFKVQRFNSFRTLNLELQNPHLIWRACPSMPVTVSHPGQDSC
jgi:hypothetical protein